jgi:hypothetical protein
MTTLYLINPVQVGGAAIQLPGFQYDSVNDAAIIANLVAAGGLLLTGTAPVVAAAALAQQGHKQAENISQLFQIMATAVFGQPAMPDGANLGDANSNIDFTLGKRVTLPSVPNTASRTYTILSAANSAQGSAALYPLYVGAERDIVIEDVAAFTKLFVNGGPAAGTLATIVASKTGYVRVKWNGTDWKLVMATPT